jgi:hypothetical protein
LKKPTRVILLDEAQKEYASLNEIVGQQAIKAKKIPTRCSFYVP